MNQEQLDTLRNELHNDPLSVGYSEMSYERIVDALNAPGGSIPNPEPQGEFPVPIGLVEILGIMSRAERIAILGNGTFRDLCLRLWTIGDNPYVDALMAFVATDPNTPFETATVYSVATRIVELQRVDLLPYIAAVLVMDGKITEDTANTLGELLARTQPDPAWRATIPTASRREVLGLPIVQASDVQQVM